MAFALAAAVDVCVALEVVEDEVKRL